MSKWVPDGYISRNREDWLPELRSTTSDEEADRVHRRILERTASMPGIDEALAEGDSVYDEFVEMIRSGKHRTKGE